MPFFDRGKEQRKPDPLARLRQYTPQPSEPAGAPPASPEEEPAAAPPPPAGSSPPPVASTPRADDDTAELDAILREAVRRAPAPAPAPPPAPVNTAPPRGDGAGNTAAAAPPVAAPPAAAPAAALAPPTAFGGPGVASTEKFRPARPTDIEGTGLTRTFLMDHIVRALYFGGEMTGAAVADALGLPFNQVIDSLIEQLRRENILDVRGQRGIGEAGYLLVLSDKGTQRAQEALQKLQYRGPAPVPLDDYNRAIRAQTNRNVTVTQENIRHAFSDLLINDSVLDEVGPGVNSGSSMFLFGYPGNGKTSIAERITRLMGDSIFIPYAVEVDGQVIKLFDNVLHEPIETDPTTRLQHDRRWMEIKRPPVVVGGELTMASLDLLYNDVGGYYEAPLQMKANGGMFLIDDFGRQLVRPTDLLNRWIVPLEKRTHFLTLITGKKISIPFEELIVFSTNLDPGDLVDEAFLRRIKFKINVLDPDEHQFREIFKLVARSRGIEFDENGFQYLLDKHYRPTGRALRMCQPRDLLDQMLAIAKYKMLQPAMTPDLLDLAASTYFVSLSKN